MRPLGSRPPIQYNGALANLRRFMMRTCLLVTLILALSGCTSMLLGNTSTRESTPTTRTSGPTAADTAISGEIRRKLGEDSGLSDYVIGITTRAGRVTLSGTVGSYPLRDRASSIARGTAGVSDVDSRIIVNNQYPHIRFISGQSANRCALTCFISNQFAPEEVKTLLPTLTMVIFRCAKIWLEQTGKSNMSWRP